MVRRRSFLRTLPLLGMSGCLRLSQENEISETTTGSDQPKSETSQTDSTPSDSGSITLSLEWEASHDITLYDVYKGTIYGIGVESMVAVGGKTGDRIWRRSYKAGEGLRSITGVDQAVYVATGSGEIHKLSPSSGDIEWTYTSEFRNTRQFIKGDGTVVAVTASDLEGRSSARVVALEASTGEERWSVSYSPDNDMDYWPTSAVIHDGVLYLCANKVFRFNIDDKTKMGTSPEIPDGYLNLYGDTLYAATDGNVISRNLNDDVTNWANSEVSGTVRTRPILYGDTVYVGSNAGLYAIDKSTGSLRWKKLIEGWGTSVIPFEDAILLQSDDNVVYGLRPETGETLFQKEQTRGDIARTGEYLLIGGTAAYSLSRTG